MERPEQPPSASRHQYQSSKTSDGIRHISTATAPSTNNTVSSGPSTPLDTNMVDRRPSHPATSPIISNHSPQPKLLRRVSSTTSLNRAPPSPKLLHKASRTSLGGAPEEREKRLTPKRSISNLIVNLREAQSAADLIEEPVPLTAPQIAKEYFARQLSQQAEPSVDVGTAVILHDACYGHRYSRLKATKATLSMIVERPERIHASILGASTAYVRLGGHHAGAKSAPYPNHIPDSAPPFTIRRTARSLEVTSSFVTNVHGTSWMSELDAMSRAASERLAAGVKELARHDTPGQPPKEELHEGDLYLAPGSLAAFQGALGGVADAVDTVFSSDTKTKRAFVAVRPPGHHCSKDHPSGFCWLNNVHVGIEYAAQTYGLTHAAIFDFDLHHGDGSQSITWERNSRNNIKRLNAKPASKLKLGPDIGYYSLHDINSYPCETGDDEKVQAASLCIENAHGQSIWNVHLQPWKTEDEFWSLYENRYRVLLDKARDFLRLHTVRLKSEGRVQPKAAIFISAGFDASEWEGAGMQRHKVNVPTEFYARFTRDMVQLAQEADVSCQGRVISVLEGGYSDRALCSGVLSHLSGLCALPVSAKTNGVGSLLDLSEQMNGLSLGADAPLFYDKTWWSAANLTALENKVNPPPPQQGKKVRAGPQPTYATPTESFAYKVVDPARFARSVSGTMREAPIPTRPPTPPPPEVDWVIATQELSKLLIPTDRQTKSCTAEELGGVRVKKEPQPTANTQPMDDTTRTRQLRDRKGKAAGYAPSNHSDETPGTRSVSRASRRETIDVLPTSEPPVPARRSSRRLSAGSNLGFSSGEVDPAAPPVPALPAQVPTNGATGGPMKPPAAPNGPVQVKKTRVPAKPRRTPSTGAPTSPTEPVAAPASHASANAAKADIDSLSSGIKKITLKVSGTKEEHDRKQKEKLDAERRARALKGAETRRANAAAKKAAKENTATSPISPSNTSIPGAASLQSQIHPQPVHTDYAARDEGRFEPEAQSMLVEESNSTVNTMESDAMSTGVPSISASDGVQSLDTTSEANTTEHPHTDPPPIQVVQQPEDATYLDDTTMIDDSYQRAVPTLSPMKTIAPEEQPDYTLPSISQTLRQDSIANEQAETLNPNEGSASIPLGGREMRVASPQRPGASKLPVWTSTGPIPFAPVSQIPQRTSSVDQSHPNHPGF